MAKIIVEILGGVLQNVTSDTSGQEVMVIDYDNIKAGDAWPATFDPIPVVLLDSSDVSGTQG